MTKTMVELAYEDALRQTLVHSQLQATHLADVANRLISDGWTSNNFTSTSVEFLDLRRNDERMMAIEELIGSKYGPYLKVEVDWTHFSIVVKWKD